MELLIETRKYGTKAVYFDNEDWELIKDYVWHIQNDKGNFYARCNTWVNGKRKSPKMHRMILGLTHTSFPHVDHRDQDGLNNRKSNLRTATIPENSRNVGLTVRNTTGYKGVYLYKKPHLQAGLYTATLRCKDKKYHGGYFKTAEEAAKRYNELAIEHHGEFAFLNTINKGDNSVTA